MINKYTYRLFRVPTFKRGMASLIDITGKLNEIRFDKSGSEADYKALSSDWKAVGEDLQNAMNTYGRKKSATRPK
ncbi:MAG: hypothetical protein HYV32_00370 [Candidatus Kerfeldbacteria bacterium]|nr:hypothetical protein [Candidatus Kerfeldbacteria bacterium]